MSDNKFLQTQDIGGVLTAELEAHRLQWQAEHPDIRVTISDIMRITMREGLNSLRARKSRLEDKQKTGRLRKGV